jgi:hypothetical protein
MKDDTGWYIIKHYSDGVEIWKTPVKYCVCHQYCRKFKFVDNLEAAKEAAFDLQMEIDNI